MSDSPHLNMPRLVEGQASAEITHNEAVNKLDAFVQLSVIDRGLTEPPAEPNEGDRYLVATGGTGAWEGQDGNIAIYYSGWLFLTPKEGWRMWVADEDLFLIYDGADWGGGTAMAAVYSDATRPAAGVAGRIIFNTDDGKLNIDTGAGWTLPDGSAT